MNTKKDSNQEVCLEIYWDKPKLKSTEFSGIHLPQFLLESRKFLYLLHYWQHRCQIIIIYGGRDISRMAHSAPHILHLGSRLYAFASGSLSAIHPIVKLDL